MNLNETYEYMGGTSMATPHVAGLIAYLCALDPDLTIDDIITILRSSSRPNVDASNKVVSAPAIDAFKAVMAIDDVTRPRASSINGSRRHCSTSTTARWMATIATSPTITTARASIRCHDD